MFQEKHKKYMINKCTDRLQVILIRKKCVRLKPTSQLFTYFTETHVTSSKFTQQQPRITIYYRQPLTDHSAPTPVTTVILLLWYEWSWIKVQLFALFYILITVNENSNAFYRIYIIEYLMLEVIMFPAQVPSWPWLKTMYLSTLHSNTLIKWQPYY
jgi:hypothetical protein